MRTLFLALFLFVLALPALAYEPVWVELTTPFELYDIEDINAEAWFVGTLNEFPHTFEFSLSESTVLEVQLMVPADTPERSRTSLIVVREVTRGVEEVMRRTADKETWVPFTDSKSKLDFTESSQYVGELTPGTYRLEVSNPVNQGRYVLKMGSVDTGGYFNTVGDIMALRSYLDHSSVGIILNPYIFMPLFILLSLGFFGWYFRRKIFDKLGITQ